MGGRACAYYCASAFVCFCACAFARVCAASSSARKAGPGWRPGPYLRREELREEIDTALEKLSYEHRTVLILHEFENLEYKEIAKAMHCSIGTGMSRLFYARRRLGKMLSF